MVEIAGRDILRIIACPVFEALIDPYQDAKKLFEQGWRYEKDNKLPLSLFLSIFVVLGFFASLRERVTAAEMAIPFLLGVIVLWPWETIRFVLPMTPFVLFYFLIGVGTIQRLIRPKASPGRSAAMLAMTLALCVGMNLYGNATYLSRKFAGSAVDQPQWLQTFADLEKMMGWIGQSIPPGETIVTLNPPLVHLYTGHHTVAWGEPADKWELWKQLRIRYLVWFSVYQMPAEPELASYPVIYRARNLQDFRVIDLGPVEKRGKWGEEPARVRGEDWQIVVKAVCDPAK